MNTYNRITKLTLWTNRLIALVVGVLLFTLPAVIRWYCTFRVLTPSEQMAIRIAFYCCAVVIGAALWNVERLLQAILRQEVFVRENVKRIRRIQWCCGIVGMICIPAAFVYMPLIFMVIVMAFLCLVVGVVACVMDAAVAIREENDMTI